MICSNCGNRMKKTKEDYKYVESGLDNVVLSDIMVYKCACGEKVPLIPDIVNLHQVIGLAVVKSKFLLTAKRIKYLRKELGLKATDLAKLLGVSKISVSRWETGKETIGVGNDRLIRVLYLRKIEKERKEFSDLVGIFKGISKSKKGRKTESIKIPSKNISQCVGF